MTVIEILMWLLFIGILISFALVLIAKWIDANARYSSKGDNLQRIVDLRLTYKRYMELYPGARMSYDDYKRLQKQNAYRKAVSSTKIKRMVR